MSKSLLLIDDNAIQCHLVKSLLAGRGFNVECTQDAELGLAWMRHRQYDALLLDLKMPTKTGWDVLREMNALEISVPTAVITCYDLSPEERNSLRSLGAKVIHTEPLTLEALLGITNQLLTKEVTYGRGGMAGISGLGLGGVKGFAWCG